MDQARNPVILGKETPPPPPGGVGFFHLGTHPHVPQQGVPGRLRHPAAGLLRGRTSALRPHVLAKRGGASVTSMGSPLRPWAPAPTPPWSSDPPLLPLWVPTLGSTPRVLLLLPLWVLALGSTPWVLALPPWSPGRGGGGGRPPKPPVWALHWCPCPCSCLQPQLSSAPKPPGGGGGGERATPKTTCSGPAVVPLPLLLPPTTTLEGPETAGASPTRARALPLGGGATPKTTCLGPALVPLP